jgi:hypothetical protein
MKLVKAGESPRTSIDIALEGSTEISFQLLRSTDYLFKKKCVDSSIRPRPQEEAMDNLSVNGRIREYGSILAAIGIGPLFLVIADRVGLLFRAAASGYMLVCVLVIPLLTVLARRFKFLAWQVSVASMAITVISDDLRIHAIHRTEIIPVGYVFWAFGTLLSSPLPVYFFLKPLHGRMRTITFICIVAIASGLWLGIYSVAR